VTTPPPTTDQPTGQRYTSGPPDFNPDPMPDLETWEQVYDALERNPIYDHTLGQGTCNPADINLLTASPEALEAYFNESILCMMYVWYGVVEDAGFWMPRPPINIFTEPVQTPCGTEPTGGVFYCSGNQQIYFAPDYLTLFPSDVVTVRLFGELIIAHEFGHAIQNRTWILWGESSLSFAAQDEAEALSYSRRLELQADCFSGLFIHSIAASVNLDATDEENLRTFYRVSGDGSTPNSGTHGMGVNQVLWYDRALTTMDIGVCNTWTAPANEVS
jgi:predicted metalloprotease